MYSEKSKETTFKFLYTTGVKFANGTLRVVLLGVYERLNLGRSWRRIEVTTFSRACTRTNLPFRTLFTQDVCNLSRGVIKLPSQRFPRAILLAVSIFYDCSIHYNSARVSGWSKEECDPQRESLKLLALNSIIISNKLFWFFRFLFYNSLPNYVYALRSSFTIRTYESPTKAIKRYHRDANCAFHNSNLRINDKNFYYNISWT